MTKRLASGEIRQLDGLQIRPFHSLDTARLVEIYLAARRVATFWTDPAGYSIADFQRVTEKELILVAEGASGIAGFSSSWTPQRFLHHLYIDPEHARKGIGGRLLEATVEKIGAPARLKCLSRNQPALDFYLRRGWRVIGTGAADDGEHYEMEWRRQSEPR